MDLKALDLFLLTKLTSHHVDHVTCIECCKYFIAPETASCGHTLCHSCWRGRRTCPACAASLEKRSLKLNLPMQVLTAHIQELGEAFEKVFNIKLDEFVLEMSHTETESSADPTRNVKDWLASSQNHFSAPLLHSEPEPMQESTSIKILSSDIQIHDNTKKNVSSDKLVYVQQPQDDWDKIEQLPDTEELPSNKENILLPNNQLSSIEGCEYTTDNPRRSSRKRESKCETTIKTQDMSLDKLNSKNSSSEIDKKSSTAKQNWNNVKRMRKEFSKLNKKNRNKLNVSIEMCKKNQNAIKPSFKETEQKALKDIESPIYMIEESTPVVDKDKNNTNEVVLTSQNKKVTGEIVSEDNSKNNIEIVKKNKSPICENKIDVDCNMITNNDDNSNKNMSKPCNNTNRTQNKPSPMPFIKKGLLYPKQSTQTININRSLSEDKNTDEDIEISIKIGSTITKIVIKKKTNDVQLKINSDQEVQTSLGSYSLCDKNNSSSKNQDSADQNVDIILEESTFCDKNNSSSKKQDSADKNDIILEESTNVAISETVPKSCKTVATCKNALEKSVSTKINTASAETVTAPFEITESVEKELSNIMECDEAINKNIDSVPILSPPNSKNNNNNVIVSKDKHTSKQNTDDIDAFDAIFDIDYAHTESVNMLGDSKHIASEILMPIDQSKNRNMTQKRDRDFLAEEISIPDPKKFKSMSDNSSTNKMQLTEKIASMDNDSINYDHVMNQVFANIDADIEKSQKDKTPNNEVLPKEVNSSQQVLNQQFDNQKCSENIFSITEKETETIEVIRKDEFDNVKVSTQRHIENLLTPGISEDIVSTYQSNLPRNAELVEKEIFTPHQDNDDSDKSVVEETPQKNVSFSKTKTKTDSSSQKGDTEAVRVTDCSEVLKSVINISDSVVESVKSQNRVTIVETVAKPPNTETPLTINRFVNQIKHKSTPVARKSLNFESENIDDDDPEQTLCPSSIVAKTTQEKEFMSKAFEQTPTSPVKKPLLKNNTKLNEVKYCIAGSCLSVSDINNIKLLCRKYNWKYVDKYSKELTHLVVGVDNENKSQRSVKYMCALAASKWIVSYQWVEACLLTNRVLGENQYEALDGTGEPGPKRSRLAKKKLFDGITFFCMPPFSVLDADTLKEMLEASGGKVVCDPKSLTAIRDSPALLLAEPEHTQEDRFTYLSLELGIVPVNYEWALNCLGSYTLTSIHDLLLCPSALLPPATAKWPAILISRDSE